MIKQKKIVILGAGFAGVYAFLALHKKYHNDPSVKIIMVNRTDYFLFTPLLHEVATGGVSPENLVFTIRSILKCCLGDLVQADVRRIDLARRVVETSQGSISYDVLLYALGASVVFFGLSHEAQKQVIPLKTLADAKHIKTRLIELFEQHAAPSIVIVGGGPTGVEVAAEAREYCDELARAFRRNGASPSAITLIHGGNHLLPQFHPRLGVRTATILRGRDIRIILNNSVVDVMPHEVILKDGVRVTAHLVIWAAGVAANAVSTEPRLALDAKDRIITTPFLNMTDYPEVFVAGDAAQGAPMTAQAAVRAGKAVGKNIYAFLSGKPLAPFTYHHKGDLFSLGQWMAGAEIFGVRFFGHFAWWLWRTIYLSKIIGLRNKVNVAVDWTLNLFLPRDITK